MRRGQWCARVTAGVAALAASVFWAVAPASAATGPVSSTPASGTPQLASTGTTEQVRQLAQCGGTMYAVGSFTSIKRYSTTYTRNNAFSFSATSPYAVSSWDPNVNGKVNSITFSPDCSVAYLGGSFTSIGGTAVKNIAAVSTSTGAVIPAFGSNANGQVETLLYYNGHILTGGYYTSINDSTSDKYMTSLNPSTGKDDGFIKLNISGNYQFPGVAGNPTRVYNQQLSHGGTLDMVEGDFTSVGGQARQQMFMLDLSGSTAAVTGWNAARAQHQLQLQRGVLRPGRSLVTRRLHDLRRDDRATSRTAPRPGRTPRTGPCDAALAFPSTQTTVSHTWINYTGCDSLYSTAADASTAYFGGHERWSQNPNGCDFAGPAPSPPPAWKACPPPPAR